MSDALTAYKHINTYVQLLSVTSRGGMVVALTVCAFGAVKNKGKGVKGSLDAGSETSVARVGGKSTLLIRP